jgi:hypothetical protein
MTSALLVLSSETCFTSSENRTGSFMGTIQETGSKRTRPATRLSFFSQWALFREFDGGEAVQAGGEPHGLVLWGMTRCSRAWTAKLNETQV